MRVEQYWGTRLSDLNYHYPLEYGLLMYINRYWPILASSCMTHQLSCSARSVTKQGVPEGWMELRNQWGFFILPPEPQLGTSGSKDTSSLFVDADVLAKAAKSGLNLIEPLLVARCALYLEFRRHCLNHTPIEWFRLQISCTESDDAFDAFCRLIRCALGERLDWSSYQISASINLD